MIHDSLTPNQVLLDTSCFLSFPLHFVRGRGGGGDTWPGTAPGWSAAWLCVVSCRVLESPCVVGAPLRTSPRVQSLSGREGARAAPLCQIHMPSNPCYRGSTLTSCNVCQLVCDVEAKHSQQPPCTLGHGRCAREATYDSSCNSHSRSHKFLLAKVCVYKPQPLHWRRRLRLEEYKMWT